MSEDTAAIDRLLLEHAAAGRTILLRPGRCQAAGAFDFNLSEQAFYDIYTYCFYQNEWTERMIDTYFLYDVGHGDQVFRVNDDGYRSEITCQPLATHAFQGSGSRKEDPVTGDSGDYCLQVFEGCGRPQPRTIGEYQMYRLFLPNVQRSSVEEISLRYTDVFDLVLQKRVNLQTMRTSHTAFLRIQIPASPESTHVSVKVPMARVLLRRLRELELVAAYSGKGQDAPLDARAISAIEAQAVEQSGAAPQAAVETNVP